MVREASRMPFPSCWAPLEVQGTGSYRKEFLYEEVFKASGADIIVSVGSGSPIDASKAITFLEFGRQFLRQIAVPTTLSAAECIIRSAFLVPLRRYPNLCERLVQDIPTTPVRRTGVSPQYLALGTTRKALAVYWNPGPHHAVEALYRPYVVPPLKVI